jgi:hypothetical protein
MSHQNQENFFNNLNFTNQRSNNITDTIYQNMNAGNQAQPINYQQSSIYTNQSTNNNGAAIQGNSF